MVIHTDPGIACYNSLVAFLHVLDVHQNQTSHLPLSSAMCIMGLIDVRLSALKQKVKCRIISILKCIEDKVDKAVVEVIKQ